MTRGEVLGVLWIVGVSIAANSHVAADRKTRHPKERNRTVCEHPVAAFLVGKIALLDPLLALLGMTSFGPLPCHAPDRLIDVVEELLADDMAVIVAPAPEYRVETTEEDILWQADA